MTSAEPRPVARDRPATVLVVLGVCCVVAGGLVAAVSEPLDLVDGGWLAAYLVLVGGVAQYAMGRTPELLGSAPGPEQRAWAHVACWNVGNALVITGTLAKRPWLVEVGSVLLIVALAVAWYEVRPAATPASGHRWVRAVGRVYRVLLVVLLVSLPVGIVLAHVQHS